VASLEARKTTRTGRMRAQFNDFWLFSEKNPRETLFRGHEMYGIAFGRCFFLCPIWQICQTDRLDRPIPGEESAS
jgi:hypothetical protein